VGEAGLREWMGVDLALAVETRNLQRVWSFYVGRIYTYYRVGQGLGVWFAVLYSEPHLLAERQGLYWVGLASGLGSVGAIYIFSPR
jgi:hypothetical protein